MKEINLHNYEAIAIDYLEGNLSDKEHTAFLLFLEQHPQIREELDGISEITIPIDESYYYEKASLKKQEIGISTEDLDLLLIKKLEGELTNQEEKNLSAIWELDQVQNAWELIQCTQLTSTESSNAVFNDFNVPIQIDYTDTNHLIIGELEGDLNIKQTESLRKTINSNVQAKQDYSFFSKTIVIADQSITYPNKTELKKKAVIIPLWKRVLPYAGIAALLLLGLILFNPIKTKTHLAKSAVSHNRTQIERLATYSLNEEQNNESIEITYTSDQQSIIPSYENNIADNNPITPKKNTNPSIKTPVEVIQNQIVIEPISPLAHQLIDQERKTPTLLLVSNLEPEKPFIAATEPSNGSNTKTYNSLWDLAESKTKEKLWGEKDYPEEDYSSALIERTIDNTNAFEEESVVDFNDDGWEVKIGKFGVKRIKG